MGSDIFTAVKGLTSPTLENAVFPQNRTSSTSEQVRRASLARLEQQNRNTEQALAFFKGKRLLGGNLLLGGGKPVDPFVTRSLFAELQKNEDDAFALILRQAQERVQKNQFLPSAFNPVSSEERVQRLLENAPHAREPQRYRYSNYDPVADKKRQEALQARNDEILQAARSRLARSLLEGKLPDASERPRVQELLPPHLSETKLDSSINLRLSRNLAHADLGTGTVTNLILNDLLRLRRPNSFAGLTTTAQIREKQQALGLTDAQVEAEQKRDASGIPTHVQVTLQGRSLNLDPAFVEAQRRIDPNFQIESHKAPTGTLVLDGGDLSSRTARGTLRRHIIEYEDYLKLEYRPPTTSNEEQIDYFSVIAFRHPDGALATLDEKATRRATQTVALTTPETSSITSNTVTRGGETYKRYDISLPSESNSAFQEVELTFDDAIFTNSRASNILEAIQFLNAFRNSDLIIEATQQGYSKSYGDDRELTLDYEDLRQKLDDSVDNDNRVRFLFLAPEAASNGVDLRIYVRLDTSLAATITLEGVRAQFL